jgi:hypothetical protein
VLKVYVGMRAVLTHNKSVQDDFINGATGIVTAVHKDASGKVQVVFFKPDSGGPELRVAPKGTKAKTIAGEVERVQLPLLPSHCVTVCTACRAAQSSTTCTCCLTPNSSQRAKRALKHTFEPP